MSPRARSSIALVELSVLVYDDIGTIGTRVQSSAIPPEKVRRGQVRFLLFVKVNS